MFQREYLISRIFKLLLVLLKRAYLPRIPRISRVFQLLLCHPHKIKSLTYLLTYLPT